MKDRAVLFVDGNNWYHLLREAGVRHCGALDYARISEKITGPREWIATRYYICRIPQEGATQLYSDQRRFLHQLTHQDPRIQYFLGRLESRRPKNECAQELKRYISELQVPIDKSVRQELLDMAVKHAAAVVKVEKAVDVMIAVDLVLMASRNEFDTAYLLSADGDFTPAVEAARSFDKTIFAVSPGYGAQLANVVKAFIRLDSAWFDDCYC